jgi:hypothetical protein
MADELLFHGWKRSMAASGAALIEGRLRGRLELTLSELVPSGQRPQTRRLHYHLMGPADVAGLRPGAVTSTYPAPGAVGVETTKSPYAELAEPDLPWRYSLDPLPVPAQGMKPWLVLVVGTTEELWQVRGGQITFTAAVANDLPLARSKRWAHLQVHNGHEVVRLLCPRKLVPNRDYVAAIVPAYDENGDPAWGENLPADATVTSPVYHWWHFRTTDTVEDFRSLALKIAARPVAPEDRLGFAPLAYHLDDADPPFTPMPEVGGALTASAAAPPVEQPVLDHLALLRSDAHTRTDSLGRPIVRMPRYGEPWLTDEQRESLAWSKALNEDPRHRGVAGLGLWAGIEWQELIVEAATRQLGALQIAAQRIRALTAGLAANGHLWEQRRPQDRHQRLMLFGPSLARMVTERGTVLEQVAGTNRPLPPALFSSAARRVLRPGGARARWVARGALNPARVVRAANDCDLIKATPRSLKGVPHADVFEQTFDFRFDELLAGGEHIPFEFPEGDDSFFDLTAPDSAEAGQVFAFPTFDDRLGMSSEESGGRLDVLLDGARLALEAPERPCRKVRLERLVDALDRAIDPTTGMSLVVRRVLNLITGLDDQPLTPPELCPDFDLPAWKYLRDRDKNWLLPGMDKLAPDSLVAVQTNPAFVDAFLTGLNQQALSELRWRNVPIATGCTPLRRFWERLNQAGDGKGTDIVGIARWAGQPEATPLGDSAHQTPEAQGTDLVLVFRTELFYRYPSTLVYLSPRKDDDPDWQGEPDRTKPRITPTFPGVIAPDISYFGFAVGVDALDTHWVVIEEVPLGFTFRNYGDPAIVNPGPENGGAFADHTFANPVRVLFEGAHVKEQMGLNS